MSLRKRHHRRVMNRIARKCSGFGWPAEVCGKCVARNSSRLPFWRWQDAGWIPDPRRDVMVRR